MNTKTLAGTTILATLVIVFDYTLKFSGLKIPFPPMMYLRFDFTGVPIMLALLLFGAPSAAIASGVAFLAIIARSGDMLGASMKAIAEFSTVAGVALGLRLLKNNGNARKPSSLALGIVSRCAMMLLVNLIVLPQTAAIVTGSLLTAFNAIQGALTIIIGYALYEVAVRKMPFITDSFVKKKIADTSQE